MSPPKLPPPQLEGFTFVEGIEGGGFADVFLFEQHRPRRQVAIKVLRAAVTDEASRRQFEAEADHMAKVSHHPYIVTVYASDVAPPPDNRPYIVMEYYPPPHYGQRSRDNTMPVAEVLRVGVQVAAAVEFAHQADILHRDIKPSNVLASAYGWPGLTDFGLASVQSETLEQAAGISIAYAPPEVAGERSPGDVRGDVYSLAATVYALLAGRSPFERQDRNSYAELLNRIENEPPPLTGRADVPPSLELLLRQGLSKRPGDRPASALAFARALRDIQHQEDLSPTELRLDITDPNAGRRRLDPDDDPTVVPPPRVVDAQGRPAAPAAPAAQLIEGGPVEDVTSQRPILVHEPYVERQSAAEPDEAATVLARPQTPRVQHDDAIPLKPPSAKRWQSYLLPLAITAATAVVVVAVLGFATHHGGAGASKRPSTTGGSNLTFPPLRPLSVEVKGDDAHGTAMITWTPAADVGRTTKFRVTYNGDVADVDYRARKYPISAAQFLKSKQSLCASVVARVGSLESPIKKSTGC